MYQIRRLNREVIATVAVGSSIASRTRRGGSCVHHRRRSMRFPLISVRWCLSVSISRNILTLGRRIAALEPEKRCNG